ncbi:hypothetical protein [Gaoshiqia sediminis]|uniref:Uncharacterized protein n=1 Tax=Gaoshiqia sediminis TaxID=2986998 RepID=A0AA41Y6I5_9BACT|nr:hypothetical protein [Gaoshiqia sediminis]MCW0484341.1 hypothetical protein [Gaoshiqia sediminis]
MTFKERPLLLTSALALSALGSSLAMFAYLGTAAFFDPARTFIQKFTDLQNSQLIHPLYLLIFGALYLLSLVGVLKMWKWQKTGYFFYTAAQLAIWSIPLIRIGANAVSSTNTVFTLIFIGIYTVYLKSFN